MKIYLVGGAVRDQLLGLPVKERDYVVVGATADEMLQLGYQRVGKDFPVFLHPKTKEEYALARVERKVGLGYTGFAFDASPVVTLEDDLKRRDLTVNAIAQSLETGELIDPYQGRVDLDNRLLRHVSNAFSEDPVRILRAARFLARFAELGFTIAPETMELMRSMVVAGEVDALVPERVWKELERALGEKDPEKFFEVLAECGADKILFPYEKMISDATMHCLKSVTNRSPRAMNDSSGVNLRISFAVLLHALSVEQINELSKRYRVPSDYKELALLVSRYIDDYRRAQQLSAEAIVKLLQSTDAVRRKERFESFLLACDACLSLRYYDVWIKYLDVVKQVSVQGLVDAGMSGKEIAEQLTRKRIEAIEVFLAKQISC